MNSEFLQSDISMDDVHTEFFSNDQVLPLVIKPKNNNMSLADWGTQNKKNIESLLTEFGGVLFRGFAVDGASEFQQFIANVSSDAIKYMDQTSPRSSVFGNVYTSTDYPKEKKIFLHSEQSYSLNFPKRIFFYCDTPAASGGSTPIADNRKIFNNISARTKKKFLEKKYRFSRCFWPMIGVSWQKAFQTNDESVVEDYCKKNDMRWEWTGNGALKTHQIRPMVAKHPISGEPCWFNHCTFFHISTLDKDVQEMLQSSFSDDELPNNTYFGDGEAINEEVMEEMRAAYLKERVEFEWIKNDVLMLDNMLVSHSRDSYEGERKVFTGMSDLHSWSDAQYIH